MKESKIADLVQGAEFTANIEKNPTKGKIRIYKDRLYLLQNEREGYNLPSLEKMGYKYSWVASVENKVNDTDLAKFGVSDLVITSPVEKKTTTVTKKYISSILFKDITNRAEFSGTLNEVPITGVFYTSRSLNRLFLLTNELGLNNTRSPQRYGYHCAWYIKVESNGVIYFPGNLKLNFAYKGTSATIITKVTEAEITTPPNVNIKHAVNGSTFKAVIGGQDAEGIVFKKSGGTYLLYNGAQGYYQSHFLNGIYEFMVDLTRGKEEDIPAKGSWYEIKELGDPDPSFKRLFELESAIPSSVGSYNIFRRGDQFIFGCGAVHLSYDELVTYVKVLDTIDRRIGKELYEEVNIVARKLASPSLKELITFRK